MWWLGIIVVIFACLVWWALPTTLPPVQTHQSTELTWAQVPANDEEKLETSEVNDIITVDTWTPSPELEAQLREQTLIPYYDGKNSGEEMTCHALGQLLGRTLTRNWRPAFLRNPETGRNLEYDGIDFPTNIAVEYNGEHHYNYPNSWHKSPQEFEDGLYRDALKEARSPQHHITLLVVPYSVDMCVPDPTQPHGRRCSKRVSKQVRYSRIWTYLRQQLTYLKSVGKL